MMVDRIDSRTSTALRQWPIVLLRVYAGVFFAYHGIGKLRRGAICAPTITTARPGRTLVLASNSAADAVTDSVSSAAFALPSISNADPTHGPDT